MIIPAPNVEIATAMTVTRYFLEKMRFQVARFPVSAANLRRDALTPAHEMIRGVGGNGAATQ